jgi:hypothetical protein
MKGKSRCFEDVFFISEDNKTGSKNDLFRDIQQRGDIFYIEIVTECRYCGWIVEEPL